MSLRAKIEAFPRYDVFRDELREYSDGPLIQRADVLALLGSEEEPEPVTADWLCNHSPLERLNCDDSCTDFFRGVLWVRWFHATADCGESFCLYVGEMKIATNPTQKQVMDLANALNITPKGDGT